MNKETDLERWPTIRETAARGPLSEYAIRKGVREGWVPGRYIGNRFRVNYERLLQILEAKPHDNK